MKTLVLGIGSPLRGDDRVGLEIVDNLDEKVDSDKVDFRSTISSGVKLLDLMRGYQKVIFVDAVGVEEHAVGEYWEVSREKIEEMAQDRDFSHSMSFPNLFQLMEKEFEEVPELKFFLVGIEEPEGFSMELKDEIGRNVEQVVEEVENSIMRELDYINRRNEIYGGKDVRAN